MLKTLTVWNFALLEHVQVEFGPGLNILTGETGAGKSILIDALSAILGRRLSSEAIRTGCNYLRVEATFSLSDEPEALQELLQAQAIDTADDQLIITRQLMRGGRSIALVNGCHVTLAVLRAIGDQLVDIHGQNENLALLKEDNQLSLLDHYEPAIWQARQDYETAYQAWKAKCKAYEQKKQDAREYAQRLDMLHWQDKEIAEAQLKENEDIELEAEIKKLSHAEKIAGFVEESYNLLDGSNGHGESVMAALAKIRKNLEDMSRYDDTLANAQKIVEDAYVSLQEAAYELRDYGENMNFSPERLNQLQSRMDVIYRLQKKYGATIADILAHQQKVQNELADIENYDDDIAQLQAEIEALAVTLEQKAGQLTQCRQQGAETLSRAIAEQLQALGMPKAVLTIRVTPAEDYQPHGKDIVAMYFSANPGEEPKLLSRIASGGELSRIALAIKTVAAARDDSVPSMVFDEIDTGIGGKTAQMVAERIALVARYKQVLCITHLPQIACMADEHLYIAKTSTEGSTFTQIRPLSEHERIREVARMASGADVTTAALDNAKEMVSHAKLKKQQFLQN